MAYIISASIQLSSLHIIAIFVLIGFLFHYFQTNQYKKLIVGSILIGGVLGISLVMVVNKNMQISNIQILLIPVLISIISVLTGGVIAVSLKKILKRLKHRTKPDVDPLPKNEGK